MYEVSLSTRVEKSTLIVAGEVLKSESYWDSQHKLIYTSHLLRVSILYKGELEGEEIEIITSGGWVGDDGIEIPQYLKLVVGEYGLFFAVSASLPSKFGVNGLKTYHVFAEKQGFVKYADDGVNASANDIFHNYHNREKELFALIEKQLGHTCTPISPTKTEQQLLNWLETQGISLQSTPQPGIIYSFDNVQVTGANYQFSEFDVKAATSSGTADFGEGEILIEYNANVFGQNVVANGGILVDRETVIFSPDYTLTINDETSSSVRISANAITTNALYNLHTVAEKFCHVKLDISNVLGNPDILFDEPNMQGLSSIFSGGNFTHFSYVIADDSLLGNWAYYLVPVIDSIANDTVPAGVGQAVTIYGSGFGAAKGYVLFQNGDTNAVSYVYARRNGDITLWTDTKIIVRVFSADSLDKNTAGTGQIIVRTASSQLATSPQTLEILYSVLNGGYLAGSTFNRKPYRLGDFNGLGGITLQFNENFDTVSRQLFNAALDEWRCNTGVNFRMSSVDTPIDTADVADAVNVITYANLAVGVFAATALNKKNCNSGGTPTFYADGFDMLIATNPTTPWFINLGTGISANEKDLYSTMLHELGHLLNHAWTNTKVMYPYGAIGMLKRTLTNAEIAGGKKVMFYSSTQGTCTLPTAITLDSMKHYTCITSISPSISTENLRFYPNPTQDKIEIVGLTKRVLRLELSDYTGRSVFTKTPNAILEQIILPENITDGFYTITCTTEETVYVGKILIQK